MSKQMDTVWDLTPHTLAKHKILKAYFGAWLSIVGQRFPRAIFVDGFCGPGQYKGGEAGSPLVVIEEAKKALDIRGRTIRQNLEIEFHFIDLDPDRITHLAARLSQLSVADARIKIHNPIVGGFEEKIQPILVRLESRQSNYIPFLVFIDPFGVKGFSLTTIRRILKLGGAEVFLLLDVDGVDRLLMSWDDSCRKILTGASGLTEKDLEPIRNTPKQRDRIAAFRAKYYGTLRINKVASGVLPFRMFDPNGSPLHDLVFLTNNELGFVKMKESMWQAASAGDFRFSESDLQDQLPLGFDTPGDQIWKRMVEKFSGQRVSGLKVRRYVELGTIYLNKHKTEALRKHESEAIPEAERIVVSGRKGKGPKGYPDEVTIVFPRPTQP